LWLGLVKDITSISFKDDKWSASSTTGVQNNTVRKQNVVVILEEKENEYKIAPRGEGKNNKIGWVDKKYIEEICKHQKEEI